MISAMVRLLACWFALFAADPAVAQAIVPNRAAARELGTLVNAYRAQHGLPPVPLSPSLTAVAEAHVLDMATSPDGGASHERGRDSRGIPCYTHSWSERGPWTPVCYTRDHRYATFMWSKPREITRGAYPGNGYEIAASSSGTISPVEALQSWQGSAAHNGVILEQGTWTGRPWRAMGIAIYGHHAFIWFGHEPDTARN